MMAKTTAHNIFHKPPGARGQATLEFLVYLAILLAVIALFLPVALKISGSSKGMAAYSQSQSATLQEAYFLSLTRLSGAQSNAPAGFDINGTTVYPKNAAGHSPWPAPYARSPFSLGADSPLVDYNAE